jgi:hypothetical protein
MPTDPELKARENRARRTAQLQGLKLEKSPRRDRLAPDYNGWRILKYNRVIVGGQRYTLSLDDVENYLAGNRR